MHEGDRRRDEVGKDFLLSNKKDKNLPSEALDGIHRPLCECENEPIGKEKETMRERERERERACS